MTLNRHDRQLCDTVAAVLVGLPPKEWLGRLFEQGFIDRRAVEAQAIRQHIRALIREGARTSDAITWAAEHFCCSYEKARQIYYQKTNK
ncbi:MAG: hypothetical protein IJF77_04810 [Alistipes sp.]|nr:hypothetical protein [Rikenellaceae bacterium]MBQ2728524.1 hypothetical protein [Alistipes sp.]